MNTPDTRTPETTRLTESSVSSTMRKIGLALLTVLAAAGCNGKANTGFEVISATGKCIREQVSKADLDQFCATPEGKADLTQKLFSAQPIANTPAQPTTDVPAQPTTDVPTQPTTDTSTTDSTTAKAVETKTPSTSDIAVKACEKLPTPSTVLSFGGRQKTAEEFAREEVDSLCKKGD